MSTSQTRDTLLKNDVKKGDVKWIPISVCGVYMYVYVMCICGVCMSVCICVYVCMCLYVCGVRMV